MNRSSKITLALLTIMSSSQGVEKSRVEPEYILRNFDETRFERFEPIKPQIPPRPGLTIKVNYGKSEVKDYGKFEAQTNGQFDFEPFRLDYDFRYRHRFSSREDYGGLFEFRIKTEVPWKIFGGKLFLDYRVNSRDVHTGDVIYTIEF